MEERGTQAPFIDPIELIFDIPDAVKPTPIIIDKNAQAKAAQKQKEDEEDERKKNILLSLQTEVRIEPILGFASNFRGGF